MNTLYYGDNLEILKRHIKAESVDLIYLDPPFKSNQDYNVLFADQDGTRSAAQIKAFEDTWQWDQESAASYQKIIETGPAKVPQVMQSFHGFLGDNDMMAYLSMMAPRLVELKRVLKPTGSIYLHCDPTASHYLKILMDAVFESKSFRNEIIWCYRKWSIKAKQFARNHDVILFYSQTSGSNVFNTIYVDVSPGTLKRWKGQKQQAFFEGGIRKATSFEDEKAQTPCPDWWPISIINPNADERLGFPTQKPEALLERIIEASSNKGDVVLDPFCGCGSSISVAQRLNRRWIGIDITHLAITLIKHRLKDAFGNSIKGTYKVIGEPKDIEGAEELAKTDPYQFQIWALGMVDARPAELKKGADRGIDGRLYFHDDQNKTKQIIISVKGGHTNPAHIRDLRGVVEREKAQIGVLITFKEHTKDMKREAASSGFYESVGWGKKYPKIQILTISELLDGKGINYPPSQHVNVTFKKAPKEEEEGPEKQIPLIE